MKAKVFFAVLTRNPDTGKDDRVRSFLEFDFGNDVTANDVIEGVSSQVKVAGGKTAVSRRSSRLLVFDPFDKSLSEVDRTATLATNTVVQRSQDVRGSVGFLIDDVRPDRQFFRVHESHTVMPQRLAGSPPSSRQERERPAPRESMDADPETTAREALDAEISALRAIRANTEYPNWRELLPQLPSVAKWRQAIQREREAFNAHRQKVLHEQSVVDHEMSGVKAETERICRDIRDMDKAVLQAQNEFEIRASLERRLAEAREEVETLVAREAQLTTRIDEHYASRSYAAPRPVAPAIHPEPQRAMSESPGQRGGSLWPTIPPSEPFSQEDQVRSIAAMWGLSEVDLGPNETKNIATEGIADDRRRGTSTGRAGKYETVETRTFDDETHSVYAGTHASPFRGHEPSSGERRIEPQLHVDSRPLTLRAVPIRPLESSLPNRHEIAASIMDGPSSLEAGLSLLDPTLTAEVRRILDTNPASVRESHHTDSHALKSSLPLRLLASDLGLYLSTDGADSETRRQLLLRVQELKDAIAAGK